MWFRSRTVSVSFQGDQFDLPRSWGPDQVAEFLDVWLVEKQKTRLIQPGQTAAEITAQLAAHAAHYGRKAAGFLRSIP